MALANKNFSLANTTKDRVPRLPFFELKKNILGSRYELSLVIIGDKRARTLNTRYRNKTYVPNVLSFPLADGCGEIFLDLKQAKREHAKRRESFEYYTALLVVHGMLHLKGMRHGGKMESEEESQLTKVKIRNLYR